MSPPLNVLGFAGSLRQRSYNRAALAAAVELAPAGMNLSVFDLTPLPLFNQDLEGDLPAPVASFKQAVEAADALLIVTPEYNYSISGVLKNALDWASRPAGASSFPGKVAAIMGVSGGLLGTARAQYHLRQCLVALDVPVVNRPEVLIGQASQRFDEHGRLTDEPTRQRIAGLLQALAALAGRYRD